MPTEVVMPKMGLNIKEGLLAQWLAEDSQEVHRGQPIFVVETDKVATEVVAEANGILPMLPRREP